MGSYTFKWEHPAEEVYVTGTFDDWTKSVKLDKDGDVFQKTVDLKDTSGKIYYKFVVDNTWTTNESSPKEPDHDGNVNNFLTPEQLFAPAPAAAIINSVGPESSTAKMAGEQPKEGVQDVPSLSNVPGGFPETPADDLNKPIGVNPLPAAGGAVNPIKLEPGEHFANPATTEDINKYVKLDKESYEKSDAIPGFERKTGGASEGIIPESGLPMGDNSTINSVGPSATTAALAGQVPKEPKGDATINTVGPDSTTATLAGQVPKEPKGDATISTVGPDSTTAALAGQVPKEPKGDATINTVGPDSTTAALAGQVPKEPKGDATINSVGPDSTTAALAGQVPKEPKGDATINTVGPDSTTATLAGQVPKEPKEGDKTEGNYGTIAGIGAAGGAAVAGAAGIAVATKDTAAERAEPALSKVSGTTADVADKSVPDSVKGKLPESARQPLESQGSEETPEEVSPGVPREVKESLAEAHKDPEAAASASAVEHKKEMESELLREVKPAADSAEEAKPVAEPTKATETAETAEPQEPTSAANGSGAVTANGPGAVAANGSETKPAEPSAEKKKRSRLSIMLSKIKHKITD